MRPEGPTQAEADDFAKRKKYIKFMPQVVEGEREFRIKANVFSNSEPGKVELVILATAKKSPPGVPRPWPSSVLELAGRFRIRGLNYAIRHDCPSGPIVNGWHEHLWTNHYGDHVVIKAKPNPDDTSIKGVFEWGLKKWNIKVGEPLLRGTRHGKAQNR